MNISKQAVAKAILIAIIAVAVFIGLLIIAAIVFIVMAGHRHANELTQLKSETSQLLQGLDTSKVSVSKQDCHDVELQNQCYVTLDSHVSADEEKAYIAQYLSQRAFTKNDSTFTRGSFEGDPELIVEYSTATLITHHK